jgi:DNA-directed RNA polymerase beta subunit
VRIAAFVLLVGLPCSDDLNIIAVLKAMGAESDQEVVDLIGPDEQLAALLMPSLQVRIEDSSSCAVGAWSAVLYTAAVSIWQQSHPGLGVPSNA